MYTVFITKNIIMNANEFKVMALLYVVNIDGNIKAEEVKAIMEKTDNTTFETVNKMFSKMNDADILEQVCLYQFRIRP